MMKHLPTVLFAILAALFAFLHFSGEAPAKNEPVAEVEVDDPRDAEIAALRAKLLDAEMQVATLEMSQVEQSIAADKSRARFTKGPTLDESLAEAKNADGKTAEELLEEQLGVKIGGALSGLFKGLNISNVVEGTNITLMSGSGGTMGKAFKAQAMARNRSQVEKEYADLLSMFTLDFEKRNALLDLLAKRQTRWGEANEGVDAEIEAFLGEEGYKLYQGYEDTKYARKKLGDLEQAMGKGLALDADQRKGMMDLFGEMEDFSTDYQTRMGGEDSEQRLDELASRYTKLTNDASSFLNEEQTAAFASHLDNRLKQAEAQEEITRNFKKQFNIEGLEGADIKIFGGPGQSSGMYIQQEVEISGEE